MIFQPPVLAHRGASLFAPENTLAAFRKAKALGANWVEFDVMLTADDEIVVIHDETLDRTTTVKGLVSHSTLTQIKQLDAGSWFDHEFMHEKISTLQEVIELLNELKLCANIEIKAQIGREKLTVTKVLSTVQQYWQNSQAPLISSFSYRILEVVRECSSQSLIGFLMDSWEEDWERKCKQIQAVSVNVNHTLLDHDRAQQIKATQRFLLAYTVNDYQRAQELFAWGVDAVFSDNPGLFCKPSVMPV